MDISPEAWNTQDIIHIQMKLKKKEQSMDTLVLLRRGNKISTREDTETKFGAESEGKGIQRLPLLGIQPIYSNKTRYYCGC